MVLLNLPKPQIKTMKMKKILSIAVVLFVTSFMSISGTASNSEVRNDRAESICSVSCSVTLSSGYTITTSAGSIFRTCTGASLKCQQKLSQAVVVFWNL